MSFTWLKALGDYTGVIKPGVDVAPMSMRLTIMGQLTAKS
jgi:hypothetical protein